ncbi:hypothetical protein ORI20_13930 [Mycobacterium sp. CVI_P3]|uniref:Uncharacterized protein n=1 Tax=Mycobacterium pinniadriaticum TaxID=2994102 RepID=A0ABT3SE60_9MYCO|nr:hypothetical protein [Mycobacterium pinniadriaticum]MCX2931379.1 hypothetical protein [Mycobacterium pinniadriaticum]MCX2937803.1 hypothetical protein [Mycobacterium pinniadriaticum]
MFERSTSDARQEPNTHRCIAGARCRAKIIENGEPQPAYTEQTEVLCDGCHAHYRESVHRLLRDYAMLRVTLGERHSKPGAAVSSSPGPGIVIDAASDRLMTEITEWAGYAADVVADVLKIPRPDGERRLAKQLQRADGKVIDLEPGSLADVSWEDTRPPEGERLSAYVQLVEQHVDLLAAAPSQDVQIWSQPKRCEEHTDVIASAKRILELARKVGDPDEIKTAAADLQAAHAAAGACEDCCGWTSEGPGGQARQDIRISGLDVLNRLTRLHHLSRQHLGHTKLRHRYPMICPYCGSTVGRDDGETVITCDNKHCTPKGPSSWTEREYEFVSGWLADDERARLATKWLLTEAYSWLDGIAKVVHDLETDERLKGSEAVQLIVGAIKPHLAHHQKPADRKIATDKAAAKTRQASEEDWSWKRQHPYQKPKKKPKPAAKTTGPAVAVSSRTMVNDDGGLYPDEYTIRPACPNCHLTHPTGQECP